MEYNTERGHLVMPEYGRNIQKMVDYLKTIEDPEKRQKNAQTIIELMGILNPHLKNVEDFRHKLWDHLFLIADYDLDIECPYPIATREKRNQKPEVLPYPKKIEKNKHFGKNLNAILEKALEETDEDKKKGFTNSIAYYMKLAYTNWHKEPIHDDMIKNELAVISGGQLQLEDGVRLRVDQSRSKSRNPKHANAKHKNTQNRNPNYKGKNPKR